jgi:hypothetical protein
MRGIIIQYGFWDSIDSHPVLKTKTKETIFYFLKRTTWTNNKTFNQEEDWIQTVIAAETWEVLNSCCISVPTTPSHCGRLLEQ